MYFTPEREFIENSIVFSQENVNGKVRLMAYKGQAYVLGRSSESSNLYSEEDGERLQHSKCYLSLLLIPTSTASMDSLDTFSVSKLHIFGVFARAEY